MIIKDEYDYLIHLLSCALNGVQPQDIPDGLSFEKVLEYGKKHEVANIAFLAVKKLKTPPEKELFAVWNEEYLKALKRDALQQKARAEILDVLHSNGIYTLEVQGTVVKQYYPQSHLRMMSDIDIIIPADKLEDAEKAMQSISYKTTIEHGHTEIQATKNDLFIELHTEFFPEFREVSKVLNEPFSHAVLHEDFSATVTDTVFYLFHLLHTIKHANEFMGVGIRRIIDLYYLENAMKGKADLSYIDSELERFGLYETKEKLLAVKDLWFCSGKPSKQIKRFENEILAAGNHGTEEILNRNFFANERSHGKRFPKLSYALAFIFPPKEDIYEAYPFCKQHHYPAVLCWIHRWIFSIFNKRKLEKAERIFSKLQTEKGIRRK